MKKYNLLHVGTPRTGTTSLWKLLSKHQEITVSKIKEPIWTWDKNVNTYLDWFDIKDETKVLVDCTPTSILLIKPRDYFREIDSLVSRRCCIYTLRSDPIQRVKSFLGSLLADHHLRQMHSALIVDGKLSQEKLEFIVSAYMDDDRLIRLTQDFFGPSNTFVVKLQEFNSKINEFYNFLNVTPKDHKLEHYKNNAQFENTLRYVRYLKDLRIAHKYVEDLHGTK